jgi:hypothetical protein
MYNEVLKCSEVDSLNNVKDALNVLKVRSLEDYNQALKVAIRDKNKQLEESDRKLKRNRKGFIAASAIILARVGLKIGLGI